MAIIVGPSGGGVTGLTSVSGTTNRVPYFDSATTLAASELVRASATQINPATDASVIFGTAALRFVDLSLSGQVKWGTGVAFDAGVRRDAAGSLSLSDGSTGHATGLGLGTATPKTYEGTAALTAAITVSGTDAGVGAIGSNTANLLLDRTASSANQRILGLENTSAGFAIKRWADNFGSSVVYLSASLATDVVTLGSVAVAGVTINPGTAKLSHTLSSISTASAAGATLNAFDIAPQTFVITGATNITTATGFNLANLESPTYSAASALTITNAATLYIAGAPAGGGVGPATITNAYALWVDAGKTRFDGLVALGSGAAAAIKDSGGDLWVRDAGDGGYAGLWAATLKAGVGPTFVSNSQGTTLSNVYPLRWSSTAAADGLADLALYRNAAGVLEINNSNAGTFRDLKLRNLLADSGNSLLGGTSNLFKGLYLDYTNTAVGTTGNQTINKPCGRVNIAAGGTTVTVTNSLVTAGTQVWAVAATADATARVISVVPAAGSFVINTVATTAETAFMWAIINTT